MVARHVRRSWSALSVLLLLGCAADDGDGGAPVEFSASACKSSKQTGSSALRPAAAAAVTVSPAAYDGLDCLAWEVSAERATFNLYNARGACGATYAGKAFLSPDGRQVTLSLTNPSGVVALCGNCLYDFSFGVPGVAVGADLTVTLERSNSADRSMLQQRSVFTVPALARPRGVRCDYADRWGLMSLASSQGRSGTLNMPCEDRLGAGCKEGLTCTRVSEPDDRRCLTSCAQDADCPDVEAYACTDRLCQVRR
jgi:hypothetical protein